MEYTPADKAKLLSYETDLTFFNEKLQGTAEMDDEPYFVAIKAILLSTTKAITKIEAKYSSTPMPPNKCIYCGKTIRKYSKWKDKPNRKTHYKCWKRERPFEWRHLDKYII
tara:strand:+ start:138 stop:470 length:333 start_codon:yes stop_codon:yes gene_type:complete